MHQSIHFNSMPLLYANYTLINVIFYVKDCHDLLPIAKVVHRRSEKSGERDGCMGQAQKINS